MQTSPTDKHCARLAAERPEPGENLLPSRHQVSVSQAYGAIWSGSAPIRPDFANSQPPELLPVSPR